MQAVIITGGHIDDKFVMDFIKAHTYEALTIAVDSGMGFFYRNHLVPDYIVGDFDSVEAETLQFFIKTEETCENFNEHSGNGFQKAVPENRAKSGKKPVILHFQPEKDETDTELAIRTAMKQSCDTIYLLGAIGTRMDHVFGNIHLLGMAMEHGADCQILDEHNRIRMLKAGITLSREQQYGTYVSLLPFTPKVTGLTLKGFKYPLECYTLECYHSLGVSNEIVEEEAEISFEDGVLLMIESQD